jgi:hypothetical protein
MKEKINELVKNSKGKNIRNLYRCINEFNDYQPETNVVKEKYGGRITCQPLNIHSINDMQTEIHTAESLVSKPSSFEVEITIDKLKQYVTRYLSNSGRTDPCRRQYITF